MINVGRIVIQIMGSHDPTIHETQNFDVMTIGYEVITLKLV